MAVSVSKKNTSSVKTRANSRTNLVSQVTSELRKKILSGELIVGDKIPSEAALTETYSVSRTVIREASAALRSEGLVEARQGAGVFVLEAVDEPDGFMSVDHEKISSVIEMLELRAAVEVEAAGLAAMRCSPAQEGKIFEALQQFQVCLESELPTSEADQRFHLAIAEATNNPRFAEMLDLMGGSAIPRSSLQEGGTAIKSSIKYLQQIHQEHTDIANAISQNDENAAREASRVHFKKSRARYRKMLRPD